jgi:hypothetical protein
VGANQVLAGGMRNARFTRLLPGQTFADRQTLKAHWGTSAERKVWGDGENLGTIRSPIYPTALPDSTIIYGYSGKRCGAAPVTPSPCM